MPFAALHESVSVQVFGRRDDEAIHAQLRPASEKRQGTKSREAGSCGAAGAMGILPRVRAREGWSGAVAANGFPPSCYSAGPDADRHSKLLIHQAMEGSLLEAYSHASARSY